MYSYLSTNTYGVKNRNSIHTLFTTVYSGHSYISIYRYTGENIREIRIDGVLIFLSIKSTHFKGCECKISTPPPFPALNIRNKTCANILQYCYVLLMIHFYISFSVTFIGYNIIFKLVNSAYHVVL